MRRVVFIAVLCLVVSGAVVLAQTGAAPAASKVEATWNCAPPNPVHILPVGDQPDHAYGVQQGKCTASKGELAGEKDKEGASTEFMEARGTAATGRGVFIATMANGDKVNYSYTFTGTSTKDNKFQSGSNKWTMTGGTGKFTGIKGSGTCKGKGNADGSATFDCVGTYTMK